MSSLAGSDPRTARFTSGPTWIATFVSFVRTVQATVCVAVTRVALVSNVAVGVSETAVELLAAAGWQFGSCGNKRAAYSAVLARSAAPKKSISQTTRVGDVCSTQ